MFLMAGCTSQISDWVKDPHFAKHQEAMDELERSYLDKKISYSEYSQRKKELEYSYTREVKEREKKIQE